MITTKEILIEAKKVKTLLASLSTEEKNNALLKMADALIENADRILTANKSDLERAKGTISDVMLDRLALTKERIEGMAKGILEVAQLPDPVGRVIEKTEHKNGLIIERTGRDDEVVKFLPPLIIPEDQMIKVEFEKMDNVKNKNEKKNDCFSFKNFLEII